MLVMVAPMTGQLMLIAMMVTFRQWMFAAMMVPSMLGCMASLALARLQRSDGMDGNTDDPEGFPRHAVPSGGSSAADFGGADDAAVLQRLASVDLETLLELRRETDPLPWRTVARQWLLPFSMSVPVGMAQHDAVRLDLSRQGPHALVAGTTGSGKSVLLQSWCLAMAVRNPPDRLQFVFLDFKGGTAFRPLERLPHCVGNVCDLDLQHAVRALHALDVELKRRERLVAERRAHDVAALRSAPPRLVVVVDEFHALREQLPDVVNRIVRIASLGRSLGMHVIACTQHPVGQVSSEMKANMTLGLCLRVRDAMQSVEILGSGRAAGIPPSLPGVVYCNDGEGVEAWRCAAARDITRMVDAVGLAARYHGTVPPPALFSVPLPRTVARLPALPASSDISRGIPFALADDGVTLHTAILPLDHGNIGVIGPQGRGKTTLLGQIAGQIAGRLCDDASDAVTVRWTRRGAIGYETHTLSGWCDEDADMADAGAGTGSNGGPGSNGDSGSNNVHGSGSAHAHAGMPQASPRLVWLVDDADPLFDPFCADPLGVQLREALADHGTLVVFAVESSRHVRIPEQCAVRVVFPTADKATDQMNGIPAALWLSFDAESLTLPGRAVFIDRARVVPVQCPFGDSS